MKIDGAIPPASARDRLDNLTALRFFAAFSVFLHHLKPLGINLSSALGGFNLDWTVTFFFVLSGFVLAYGYQGRITSGREAMAFIAIRFFRLWPLHVACLAIAVALTRFPHFFDRWYLLLTLQHTFIPSYVTAFFVNGVSWSISNEFFFYMTFAALMLLPRRALVSTALLWTVAVFVLLLIASRTHWLPFVRWQDHTTPGVSARSFFHLFPPVRIIEFFAGMAVYGIFRRYRMPTRAVFPVQAACLVLTAAYTTVHLSLASFAGTLIPEIGVGYYTRTGAVPLFAMIVYAFAHQAGPLSTALSNRVLLWLGETSFAFYMIHLIVIVAIARRLSPTGTDPITAALLAFSISLATAAVLFMLVEKPALRWAKRTFSPPRKRVADPEPMAP